MCTRLGPELAFKKKSFSMSKIIIIGGGIIGQFSAYYLARGGHEVSVFDDKPSMSPASEGNCGLITPSHIIPLNSIAAILQGIKWLGKKDAPLKIRPQMNWTFISWFSSFIRNSSSSAIAKAIPTRHELLQLSLKLYEDFFQEEPNTAEWKKGGMLYACRNTESMDEFVHEVAVHKEHGMESRVLTKDQIIAEEPLLKDGVVGGALMEMDGWLKPDQLLKDLKSINEKNGVNYIYERVESIGRNGSTITGISTTEGSYQADEYLLSAGANSTLLAKKLKIRIPVIPGKGYNLTAKSSPKNTLKRPLYMAERKVVATPWKTGFRLGSTLEFTGYDLTLNEQRLEALKRASEEFIDIDLSELEFSPWAGWRPMKSNGIPIIERSTDCKNLILATGHSILGLSMAPATGYMVSELVGQSQQANGQ